MSQKNLLLIYPYILIQLANPLFHLRVIIKTILIQIQPFVGIQITMLKTTLSKLPLITYLPQLLIRQHFLKTTTPPIT